MAIIPVTDDGVQEVFLSSISKSITLKDEDPFNKSGKEIRKMNGLNKNAIRRRDRTIKGYAGSNGTGSKQIDVESVNGYNYLDCISPPYNMEYLSKLYDLSPAHHAAVNAKVESVFGLGYEFIETEKTKDLRSKTRSESGKRKAEDFVKRTRIGIQEWLDNLNTYDCIEEIMKKVGRDYETTGNAYIEIGRDNNGKIGYLGHIQSIYVRVRRERDGFVQVYSNQVRYFRNFGSNDSNPLTDDANPNELIHFSKYSPADPYYGIPDIISSKGALAGNEFASRYNLDYFENKAIPRHVIISKGANLSNSSVARLVEFFETGLRGQHHRSVYVPLPKGDAEIEFKSIEATSQDSSFNEYRTENNQEIFMSHRTPPSRAGVFGSGISLAASRDADKVFKEGYSRPEQRIFEKKLNKIFKEYTDSLVFKLNELELIDEDVQSQIDERRLRSGIDVPDEVRARDGKEPRPDGKGNEPMAMNAQDEAEQKAQSLGTRAKDQNRTANSPDSASGNSTGRAAKGEGRQVE